MKEFKKGDWNTQVSGATAPEGTPWVLVEACGREAWVPLADFHAGGGAAFDRLKSRHIVLLGEDWQRCLRAAARITDEFPSKPLIEKPGWTGPYFALPDGYVACPKGSEQAIILFNRAEGKCATSGSHSEWLTNVAMPLAGQHLPTFLLMAAFAAPLLKLTNRVGNFGFEIAGDKGLGKSTMQQIACSALGPPLDRAGPRYWISGNATVNGLESALEDHADLPMIIEEMALYAGAATGPAKAAKLNELIFRLSDGRIKARHGDHRQASFRFIYITSTNEPIVEVLAASPGAVSGAAADRLMMLPVSRKPYGAFNRIPEQFDNASEFAASIVAAMADNHGWAIRRFLRRLVDKRATDESKLKKRIAALQARFRSKVGVDLNDGSAARVAEAFGLVYAAGKLAQAWGALPRELRCLTAAAKAYGLNREAMPDALPPCERLVEFASRPDLIVLRRGRLPRLSDVELAAVPGFIKVRKNGARELILTPSALQRLFPDRRRVWADQKALRMLIRDKHRKGIKRDIRRNKSGDRVYCFVLQ